MKAQWNKLDVAYGKIIPPDCYDGASQLAASWPKPDLSYLGTGRRPAPEFPADLLGPFWAAWIERMSG